MATTREAVSLVAALLEEHGLVETLAALEKEAGTLLHDGAVVDPAELERKLRALRVAHVPAASAELGDEDPLMAPFTGRLATALERTVSGAHASNVLCATFCGESRELVASGGADKLIALTSTSTGEVMHRLATHNAPVLAVAAQPDGGSLLASTAMDGRVQLHDLGTRTLLHEWRDAHRKYALCATWRDGENFATCSSDGMVAAFRAGGESGSFDKCLDLPLSHDHGVTSVGWGRGASAPVLVASVQDSHVLKYYDCAAQRLWSVSMNELDDEHVSFSAMHIAVHPSGKYLAVATDRQRTFVYEWGSRTRVRTLISDFKADDFAPAPRQSWDADGRHLYVAAGEATVALWDVGMERQVSQLVGHSAIVRGLHVCDRPGSRRAVTCSFDKTVRVWGEATAPA
ncbi:hypothetical protein KFE25_007636 [Diacronema lutheri]|uniref:Uncharacterized protein n=2 Tax=Diacronema lutheri TaxID=2081491 RepID=A0A8J6CIR1_DIALT|nr:hypothetical protein KFE25_007636 [Diacronema lutheri]